VEAAGRGVTRFKPGDEVYANLLYHGYGGFAGYVSVPVDVMSLKPANLSFEEAAAVCYPGLPLRARVTGSRSCSGLRGRLARIRYRGLAGRQARISSIGACSQMTAGGRCGTCWQSTGCC
jgi:NADPH:quinone reductase-like Zn-dependent oxidoreductase